MSHQRECQLVREHLMAGPEIEINVGLLMALREYLGTYSIRIELESGRLTRLERIQPVGLILKPTGI